MLVPLPRLPLPTEVNNVEIERSRSRFNLAPSRNTQLNLIIQFPDVLYTSKLGNLHFATAKVVIKNEGVSVFFGFLGKRTSSRTIWYTGTSCGTQFLVVHPSLLPSPCYLSVPPSAHKRTVLLIHAHSSLSGPSKGAGFNEL